MWNSRTFTFPPSSFVLVPWMQKEHCYLTRLLFFINVIEKEPDTFYIIEPTSLLKFVFLFALLFAHFQSVVRLYYGFTPQPQC